MAHRVSAGSFTDLDGLGEYIIRTSGYCEMGERVGNIKRGRESHLNGGFVGKLRFRAVSTSWLFRFLHIIRWFLVNSAMEFCGAIIDFSIGEILLLLIVKSLAKLLCFLFFGRNLKVP